MSVVTGIVICHTLMEDYTEDSHGIDHYSVIDGINIWLAENGKFPLVQLDNSMSRGKHPQMKVWGGGYNYLNDTDFIEIFRQAPWNDPDQTFMIINPENSPMRVITPHTTANRGIPY